MKFTTTQYTFSNHISLANKAIASRPSRPVLACLLLVADEDTQSIALTGFDNSLCIQTVFPAQVEEGGKIALPARILNDIISRLPDGDLTLAKDDGELLFRIKSASGRYQVQGMDPVEYPELPEVEGVAIALDPETLAEALRSTLFAASGDETKQILTGVHLSIGHEGLEACGTDGHRLSVFGLVEDKTSECTVPAKALQEILKAAERVEDPIELRMDMSQAVFSLGDTVITTRLLEGQYPNYRQLIPKQFQRQLTVDRKSLLSSLERISVLADQKNNIVKLSLDSTNQELTLSVDAQDVGSGRETLPAQISGDSIDIAFNVKYLLDALKVCGTSEVVLRMNTPTSPIVLAPVGGSKLECLVMPVQIRN